jgi:hypothetical protein
MNERPKWKLSCYALVREGKNAVFGTDLSMEEARLEYLKEVRATGSANMYINTIQSLQSTIDQQLSKVYVNPKAFWTSESTAASTASVFVNNSNQKTAFGTSSAFGAVNSNISAFGNNRNAPDFENPKTNISTCNSKSAVSAFVNTSAFGGSNTNVFSAFGNMNSTASSFGAHNTNTSTIGGINATVSAFGTLNTNVTAFGSTNSNQTAAFGAFNTNNSAFGASKTHASSFGITNGTSSAFGATNTTSACGVGHAAAIVSSNLNEIESIITNPKSNAKATIGDIDTQAHLKTNFPTASKHPKPMTREMMATAFQNPQFQYGSIPEIDPITFQN